jgi:peptide/nickel transport system permease protein
VGCREATSPERPGRLNAQYGLDKPLYEQYIQWAGGFVTGDLGRPIGRATGG